MKQFTALLILMLLSGCDVSSNNSTPKVTASDPGTQQQQHQVLDATAEFLRLLDDGKSDQTWAAVSPVLKATTSEIIWSNEIKAARLGLGSLEKREPTTIGFTQHMPGGPAGNYAVAECVATFATGPVNEKVVFREDEKQWRVVGYFIHKQVSSGAENKKAPL
ncbi:DUF4019 domain-containing protein [Pseudomonas sp. KK4]|uniref:DUF4019 domain-containing protein n=1 Tax=Pseudomonas sp. KK4 TaxID=1855729 RepID=UPI00097C1AB5|nr:DUF4019 domain-containing protein [Pseudomonas sp. KK4]